MTSTTDIATEAFLETARADLQRQMARSGNIEQMTVDRPTAGGVVITASVSIAAERIEITGIGATLLEAYADLTRQVPAPILASAYRQLI